MFRPNNRLFFARAQSEALKKFAKSFAVIPSTFPTIGHDVWIGANVTLAPSIRIGTGSVIAAGSVVTRDVAPYEIVGGNPARPIRFRFSQELISQLLESRWWDYEPSDIFSEDPREIDSTLARLSSGEIEQYIPRKVLLGS